MRIFVTGGAGFIGSHLCEKLLLEEHTVVALDNFLTGSEKNVEKFVKKLSFSLVRHDIVETLPVSGHLATNGPLDFIFHLACPASPLDYQKYPLETLLTSSEGTKNVLDFALRTKTPVLFASTSEVYGDPLLHPQKENYTGNVNPIGPRSCYDEGKRYAESLCVHYARVYGLPVTIVRIFNTYGPRMRQNDGRVIPNFITQALSGAPLTLNGDGEQTRSFCYISDMVEGLMVAMKRASSSHGHRTASEESPAVGNSEESAVGATSGAVATSEGGGVSVGGAVPVGDPAFFGPINLGNPEEVSIRTLAELIIRLTNSRSVLTFNSALMDDPHRRCPDISLAKEVLGFSPKISLEMGLKKTIAWFKFVSS